MRKMRLWQTLAVVFSCLLAGGLIASALETEGSNYQSEIHHCMTCCTTHHTATPAATVPIRQVAPVVSRLPAVTPQLSSQLVLRKLDPPPKFLA